MFTYRKVMIASHESPEMRRMLGGPEEAADDASNWEEQKAGEERYEDFLRNRDLSGAGDLQLFFRNDFFHDARLTGVDNDFAHNRVVLGLSQWFSPEDRGGQTDDVVHFHVRFDDVVWQVIEPLPRRSFRWSFFRKAEIDGLADRLEAARQNHRGEFYTLTMLFDQGWISLAFRTVQVIPDNAVVWANFLRDPGTRIPLYGL